MNNDIKHTPTPEAALVANTYADYDLCEALGVTLDELDAVPLEIVKKMRANAALIVKAVNSHEALVDAAGIALNALSFDLEAADRNGDVIGGLQIGGAIKKLRAALALAKGE